MVVMNGRIASAVVDVVGIDIGESIGGVCLGE